MMAWLLPVVRCVDPSLPYPAPWASLSDVDDIPVWATAMEAGADYVVSENTRHFPPLVGGRHLFDGVEYMTVQRFLERIG